MTESDMPLALLGRLSAEAFDLARAAAEAGGPTGDDERTARALLAQLDDLLPALRALPESDRDAVRDLDGDARLDLYWVLSEGATGVSLRLRPVLPAPPAAGETDGLSPLL